MSGRTLSKRRRKKRWKIVLIVLAFLGLLAAAGYTVFLAPLLKKEQWIYKEYSVQKGSFAVGVTESGSLEYGITELNYDLDLDVQDDEDEEEEENEETVKYLKVEQVYVSSGGRISEGDPLVKLSQDSIISVRRKLESALVEAKKDYNEAQADYDIAVLEANLDYESTMIDSKYAKSVYQNSLKDVNADTSGLKIQLQECQAAVATLQNQLDKAQEGYGEITAKYNDAKALYEAMDVSDTVNFMTYEKAYLNAQTTYQNATDKIKQAKQQIDENQKKIDQLTRQINASAKSAQIDTIEIEGTYQERVLEGENAKVTHDSTVEGLKEDLQKAQKSLNDASERLDRFEQFVGEDGVLYSTDNGIITEVLCEAGQSLDQAQTLIAYAKPDDMTISVDVTQEDIIHLAVGDKVNISFTAYEDIPYTGSIRSIETTATSRNTDTISYTVVVAVEGDTEGLYGGMSSDIVFVMEEKEDAVYVSRQAIITENEKTYVYVKNNAGEMIKREVSTGLTNGVNTEILDGLKEGDTVYLASRVSSEAEVTQKMQSQGSDQGNERKTENDPKTNGENGEFPSFVPGSDNGEFPSFGPEFGNGEVPSFGPGAGSGEKPNFGSGSGSKNERPRNTESNRNSGRSRNNN